MDSGWRLWPGRDNSRDAVVGQDGQTYTTDQATIWRWRTAFQHDFAARMDWTVKPVGEANHNPEVVLDGQQGRAPLVIDARVGTPVTLDASGSRDPDGNALSFTWFVYPEAGMGIPGRPVVARTAATTSAPGAGGIPSAPPDGPPPLAPRAIIENANRPRATVIPRVVGTTHVILVVEDDGTPSLTAYRRVILNIAP